MGNFLLCKYPSLQKSFLSFIFLQTYALNVVCCLHFVFCSHCIHYGNSFICWFMYVLFMWWEVPVTYVITVTEICLLLWSLLASTVFRISAFGKGLLAPCCCTASINECCLMLGYVLYCKATSDHTEHMQHEQQFTLCILVGSVTSLFLHQTKLCVCVCVLYCFSSWNVCSLFVINV